MKNSSVDIQLNNINRGGGVRNTNLELYRILVMLLIVAHHYVVNSGLTAAGGPVFGDVWSWKSLFLLIFGAWGKTGINCFVLVTGYFMSAKDVSMKKFWKLLAEVLFYSIVISSIFWLSGYEQFSLKSLVGNVVPMRFVGSDFTGCFLLYFLFIPFLNILLQNITRKQHLWLVALCLFVYTVHASLPKFMGVTMNYVSWFCVLHFVGAYLRLYEIPYFDKHKCWGKMSCLAILAGGLSVPCSIYLTQHFTSHVRAYSFVADSNVILALLIAVCTFKFFLGLKLPQSKIINTIAASCFGVLCIHANSDTMRKWLWQDVLDNVGIYNSDYLVVHAVGSVIGTFIVCVAIDWLRINLIEKRIFR